MRSSLALVLGPAVGLAVALTPHASFAQDPKTSTQPSYDLDFLQYGAAFVVESLLHAGNVCPVGASAPCILGSGGGVAIRVGHRWRSGWMLGGTYELAKLDAANLLNLPILQQLRADGRYYWSSESRVAGYLSAGAGVAGYGSEWSVDTFGAVLTAGIGIEYESTREVFVGIAPSLRLLRLREWQDHAGQNRPGAFAQFIGLEITLEVRSPFARYLSRRRSLAGQQKRKFSVDGSCARTSSLAREVRPLRSGQSGPRHVLRGLRLRSRSREA